MDLCRESSCCVSDDVVEFENYKFEYTNETDVIEFENYEIEYPDETDVIEIENYEIEYPDEIEFEIHREHIDTQGLNYSEQDDDDDVELITILYYGEIRLQKIVDQYYSCSQMS